jgi:predicted nuclease of predicted toxin-antitoxin system
MLLSDGHDVLSAIDVDPTATDSELLDLARVQRRVLITEDKDFGELVFVRRQPHAGIIRFTNLTVDEKVLAMRELLEHHSTAIDERCIVVVTRNRIRIRRSG